MSREIDYFEDLFGLKREVSSFPVRVDSEDIGFRFICHMAGLKKEDIEVQFEQDSLVIKAKRPPFSKGNSTIIDEISTGEMKRVFTFDSKMDKESIDASYIDGVLYVFVGFAKEAKPIKVKIK